ncbi:succinate-semialdehyde dehydrogenase / glutarate-semialdehyde dehydrogenase [Ruegeria halocynthiae]|uniref:Succinate-semialdehyde dehydrogenase / glutarate-semialdehyde dehydrogenase n=1 Tax=Ruegeria halocynthiae TaxID=985054 RepID=A0A1H2Y1D0_9RHOB|nr:hypothetical protein [Ruegeria halocynthiae]SDW98785.1 succinate-semialdehyde dehydrogenase / glutarate-semialdehyde dehydrogenase [Ruegeria halocynthiae]
MIELSDLGLLREATLVDAGWVAADAETGIAAADPASGVVIGHVPNLGAPETTRVIETGGDVPSPCSTMMN